MYSCKFGHIYTAFVLLALKKNILVILILLSQITVPKFSERSLLLDLNLFL